MKYLSKTLTTFLCEWIDRMGKGSRENAAEMRVVMGSFPAEVVMEVGRALDEYRHQQWPSKKRIGLIYKVAYGLGLEWQSSDRKGWQEAFQQIKNKDWYDAENHLTRWRNMQRNPVHEDVLVIVLIGFDHITDQSSLADFYRLDQRTVWRDVLKRNFTPWVQQKLKEAGVEWEKEHLDRIEYVLRCLLEIGITGLPGISDYLENLCLSGAADGQDALIVLTRNLNHFVLPRMDGLARLTDQRFRKVPQYLAHALEFFNYGKFLEPQARKKALNKVDAFSRHFPREDIDADILGAYAAHGVSVGDAVNDFVQGLKDYIENNNPYERQRLRSVDFVFLQDEVLEFEPPKEPRSPKIMKLKGYPPSVFLRGLWIALKEYKKWALKNKIPVQSLCKIEIRGDRYKHDCEGESKEERDQNAQLYLARILGGLDEYLQRHLKFPPDSDHADPMVEVCSALCPEAETTMAFESAGSAEPSLKFTVFLKAKDKSFHKEFLWQFPRFHAYRTMDALFAAFSKSLQGNVLPVFRIPYFGELMLAKDEEEANRILQHAIDELRIENLLEAPGWDPEDPMISELKDLAFQYALFVNEVSTEGLFTALQKRYTALEGAFRKAYGNFLEEEVHQNSPVGPLLFKAFCILGEQVNAEDRHWMWHPYEPAFVVTTLNPALLEMLYHQHAFLCEAFVTAAWQGLIGADARELSDRGWAEIEDLAQIQWPVNGTIRNVEGILDTNVRGYGLIHLVGENPEKEAALTTRLLLRYEADEDDELTDEELFGETRESRLVNRVLADYRKLHLHADDGLAIAAYCGAEIQHVIAGIHAFLKELFLSRQNDRPYTLTLTIFSESQDDTTIFRWIREWRQRWEMVEQESKLAYYKQCRISIAHRLVAPNQDHVHLTRLLGQIDADLCFLMKFIVSGIGENHFVKTGKFDYRTRYRMFPVLEKLCCPVSGGMYERRRERIISNRQFKLATLHTAVMAKLKHMAPLRDEEYLVVGGGDFGPWVNTVDKLHERCTWVVCIDPLVDEYLLAKKQQAGSLRREIIGFGSGVGAHGEYNYTVSTEKSSLALICKKIQSHVIAKFNVGDNEAAERIANSLIQEATRVGGLSLVKATGPTEYVRDFMAYAMVRKLLPRDHCAVCDEIVSLDAYRHWFEAAPSDKRPDLLHVRAFVRKKYFDIEVRVIECKLAQKSERHLEKAWEQVAQGLMHLMDYFKPREGSLPDGLEQRPDQRYWWLQIHRLVASKSKISSPEMEKTVEALENLSEGLYTIRWGAAVITFWTDVDGANLIDDGAWDIQFRNEWVPIKRLSAGRSFIKVLCDSGADGSLILPVETPFVFCGVPKEGEEKKPSREADEGQLRKPENLKLTHLLPHKIDSKSFPVSSASKTMVPERILLGKGSQSGVPVYWEFGHSQLSNRHLLIFGTSGMGKTYSIQALLCELGRFGQNSLIVDYTDGFHDEHLEEETIRYLKPKQHIIKNMKVPINPFRRQQDVLGGQSVIEDPMDTAQRVAGVFSEVYELGDQQKAAIYSAVKRGIEHYGDAMSLEVFPRLLMECAEDGAALGSAVSSVISKMQPFVDMNPFGDHSSMSWDQLFTDIESRCHILQLAGYLKNAARLITEFSLIDFYWYCRTQGDRTRPKIVVLDEIQNLDQRLESPLGKFLTEGRKFGICLIAATQTLSYLQKDQKDRLFQAAHKLFFRPAETEVKNYAQILENATQEKVDIWVRRLSSLEKGECYSLGPALKPETNKLEMKATKIRIVPLGDRFSLLPSKEEFRGPVA